MAASTGAEEGNFKKVIEAIQGDLKADLFLYSAEISEQATDCLIKFVREQQNKKENVVLILTTYGGDAHSAYRLTRFLKRTYKKFILFVFGYCKSAGTLIAIGADAIIMSDFAELGPLDVQVLKQNEFSHSSGLNLQKALDELSSEMFAIFEWCFLKIVYKSGMVISTQMAAELASSMAVKLLEPITSKIDPLKLGELSRSVSVASEYGKRLNPELEETIEKLVSDYPSHSFCIDREEAHELFKNVREPKGHEIILELFLEQALHKSVRLPNEKACIFPLGKLFDDDLDEDEDLDLEKEDKDPEMDEDLDLEKDLDENDDLTDNGEESASSEQGDQREQEAEGNGHFNEEGKSKDFSGSSSG